ncbi:hypothetical protein EW026_g5719 [Hermanssonia centrifuga]|uniref:DUF6533 domain-containing protein n=1 Tax=Hermanssonia centrifuga TaxID=98765 RepID=A0A4V3X9Z1_9APHY|nr:hypothetical protein EW026_g5719 [Hermanssonia centrifuga]
MADTSSNAELAAAFQAELAENFSVYGMSALIAYEYIITVHQEIRMVWQRKWTLATWIFMANRYLMITMVVFSASPYTPQMVQYSVFAVFSALRVFAIWDRNVFMALLMLVLNLVPVATNTYVSTQETIMFTTDTTLGTFCGYIINVPTNTIFENGVFRVRNRERDVLNFTQDLITNLNHASALLILNIAQIVLKTVPILISRFLFNLRQVGEPAAESGNHQHITFSSRFTIRVPTLASIVGNMGEELDHGPVVQEGSVMDDPDEIEDLDSSASTRRNDLM